MDKLFFTFGGFVIIYASSCIAYSLEDSRSAQKIYEYCRNKDPKAVLRFEKRNRVNFGEALTTELGKYPESKIPAESSYDAFCSSFFGSAYGTIKFISAPQGAKIFVGGDLQRRVTNSEFAFHPGSYSYKIEMKGGKACDGHATVEENKTTNVQCK